MLASALGLNDKGMPGPVELGLGVLFGCFVLGLILTMPLEENDD